MNEIHVGNNLDFATLQSRVIDDIVQLLSRSSCIEVQLKTSTASNCWNSELIVLRELDEVKIGRLLAEHEMKIFAEISATHHSHFITYRFLSAGKHRKVECILIYYWSLLFFMIFIFFFQNYFDLDFCIFSL